MTTTEINKLSVWKAIFQKRMFICILNGFTAGLPLYYIYQLIPVWLRDQNVDLKTIGLFSLVAVAYNWKFVWSPVLDRFTPPLGRRRGWMLITQIMLMISMAAMGLLSPQQSVGAIAWMAFAIAFFSATQDIVLDAYRRELLPDNELGLGNSMYANAYRVAGFIPGGLAFILADIMPWAWVHVITASFMLVGIGMTLWITEAAGNVPPPKTLREAVVEPFKEFFQRKDLRAGFLILAFLFFYKFGDVLATALQSPFFLDMGYSKTVIGSVVKVAGVWAMLVGTFLGGVFIYKVGVNKGLWIFGFLQMITILGFVVLSMSPTSLWILSTVVFLEYLAAGLGSAGLMAFMATVTNKRFTATQFALFSSLIALPRTLSGAMAGFLIEGFGTWSGLGYTQFFVVCTFCAIPGIALLRWVAPWNAKAS